MDRKKILVAFATNSGSTEEIARTIGDILRRDSVEVDVRQIERGLTPAGYDAVVVGAPLILGWHRGARAFLRRNQRALLHLPTAVFLVGMSLTAADAGELAVPLAIDPDLVKPPARQGRPSIRERFTSVPHYLGPVRDAAPGLQPVSLAIFGGKLDLYRLNWLQMLFVMLVVQAQPTDARNWPFIRSWAEQIAPRLSGG